MISYSRIHNCEAYFGATAYKYYVEELNVAVEDDDGYDDVASDDEEIVKSLD